MFTISNYLCFLFASEHILTDIKYWHIWRLTVTCYYPILLAGALCYGEFCVLTYLFFCMLDCRCLLTLFISCCHVYWHIYWHEFGNEKFTVFFEFLWLYLLISKAVAWISMTVDFNPFFSWHLWYLKLIIEKTIKVVYIFSNFNFGNLRWYSYFDFLPILFLILN